MAQITLPHEPVQYKGDAISMNAEAAINEAFACVKSGTADGSVIQTAGAAEAAIGIAKYETDKTYNVAGSVAQIPINTIITVFISGTVWAVAGAAIAKGAMVGSAAGGQVVTATAASPYIGKALTAAAAQHEKICIEVIPGSSV